MNTQFFIITGPESSGKTTLAKQLADYHGLALVPEVSRDYLNRKLSYKPDFAYTPDDLLEIARQQHARETASLRENPVRVVCDTDLLVIMIWSEVHYGDCHPWIRETLADRLVDANPRHYFLCDWDIPWESDPLRENPDDRDKLFELYLDKLKQLNIPFTILKGSPEQRLQRALQAMEMCEPCKIRRAVLK